MLRKIVCTKKNPAPKVNVHLICNDALLLMMQYLNKEELLIVSKVCLLWAAVARNNIIWKSLSTSYLVKQGIFSEKKFNEVKDFKKAYISSLQAKRLRLKYLKAEDAITVATENFDDDHSPRVFIGNPIDTAVGSAGYGYDCSPLFGLISHYWDKRKFEKSLGDRIEKNKSLLKKVQMLERETLEHHVNEPANDEAIGKKLLLNK